MKHLDDRKLVALSIVFSVLALAVLLFVGCARAPQLTGPSAGYLPAPTALVTIESRVDTVVGPPLSGVTVSVNGDARGNTGDAGAVTLKLPADGRELTIAVSHSELRAFVPEVTSTLQPNSHETWTFAFHR